MKKLIPVAVLLAVLFCFAACSKKGEVYEPPMTEVITFEDGLTAIFEVVTEENGEVATDAEGETKYIPYIPPVTEEGGYLVTCRLTEQEKTLLEYKVLVPDEMQAHIIADQFLKHPTEKYQSIMAALIDENLFN